MKTYRIFALALIAMLLIVGSASSQTVPGIINYQGKLMDGTNLFNGLVEMSFRLYDAETGGILHYEDSNTVAVVDGLYATFIGDDDVWGQLDNALYQEEVWIEVVIDGQVIVPRERLASVGYARFANRLPANAVDMAMIAPSAVQNWHIGNNQVRVQHIQNASVTSNKIDWSTMPALGLKGYAENGNFAVPPVASGADSIAMGLANRASGDYSTVGGGLDNTASGAQSVVSGGSENLAQGDWATIGGGSASWASGTFSTISGGDNHQATGYTSTIGGGSSNEALERGATVAGGRRNQAEGEYSFVGGGTTNRAVGERSTIGGGHDNNAGRLAATIGGGGRNMASANYTTIGGGLEQIASGDYGFIGGGRSNLVSGDLAGIVGGDDNRAGGDLSLVGGGEGNRASGRRSFIGGGTRNVIESSGTNAVVIGGQLNIAEAEFAVVGGGRFNIAGGVLSFVGGGTGNETGDDVAAVVGGAGNVARGPATFIGGGVENDIGLSATNSLIAGGQNNTIATNTACAFIGGGAYNTITGQHWSVISGGSSNLIEGTYLGGSTIAGGRDNRISSLSPLSTISGGLENLIHWGGFSVIGGGSENSISGCRFSVIGGGWRNEIDSSIARTNSTIAGGFYNRIHRSEGGFIGGGAYNSISTNANYAVVVGGIENRIGYNCHRSVIVGGWANRIVQDSGGVPTPRWYGAILGGQHNEVHGSYGAVAGGFLNKAWANSFAAGGAYNVAGGEGESHAFAGGRRAQALHRGSFVWGIGGWGDDERTLESTAEMQVTFGAAGGFRIFSNTNQTLGVRLNPNQTSWSAISDREAKENFEEIDTRAILEGVAALPLSAWNYRADPGKRRYIGPVAQDFHAAFDLGDEQTINTLDTDGVLLAAIQGLYAEVTRLRQEATAWHGDQGSEVGGLKSEVGDQMERLQAENAELRARLERLEAMLGAQAL